MNYTTINQCDKNQYYIQKNSRDIEISIVNNITTITALQENDQTIINYKDINEIDITEVFDKKLCNIKGKLDKGLNISVNLKFDISIFRDILYDKD